MESLILVQVGDDVWVRLDRIEGLRRELPGMGSLTLIFVIGNKGPYESDWPIEKVVKALGKEIE